jgi:flavin reductase (DIM6/NTAB) family NADH-FMN oxidoreductase RutF
MDESARKTALRMIPYGLYVLTAEGKDGQLEARTVSWVTQASFAPPLVAVAVRADSSMHAAIKESRAFCLNILGKGQESLATAFSTPAETQAERVEGHAFRTGKSGAPVLTSAAAFLECALVGSIERGDHSVFAGEVLEAGVVGRVEGRPDEVALWVQDLGDDVFYGG